MLCPLRAWALRDLAVLLSLSWSPGLLYKKVQLPCWREMWKEAQPAPSCFSLCARNEWCRFRYFNPAPNKTPCGLEMSHPDSPHPLSLDQIMESWANKWYFKLLCFGMICYPAIANWNKLIFFEILPFYGLAHLILTVTKCGKITVPIIQLRKQGYREVNEVLAWYLAHSKGWVCGSCYHQHHVHQH